ncbi:translation machinery-associated protein 16 [Neocucurbitaria cava]|uniref:Translation machinery-associated protein 16 n=1 Tax=Neocucurbitaria cava TaxID=798079 RepID=A0A9W8Y2H5_9PLEO|nr:translation machinery-associated protein 16 [Neocucurbitaria cava]
MVSNRLNKVHKQITKKKGKSPNLHENSRDTQRLQRAAGRDDKINRLGKVREKQNRTYLLRIKSFQQFTTEHSSTLSIPEIQAMIEDYLGRDDEELAKLKADRRPGRPPMTRQTLLEQNQVVEQGEYASGFWVPDLEDEANLRKLKEWNGQWANLATLKFARISKEGFKRDSSFPPKGMS